MKIDFQNTEIAFHASTNRDLLQASFLFKTLKYPRFVRFLKWLTNISFKLRLPIKGIIRATIFRQFCGGETIEGCQKQIERLAKEKVGSVLDYSAEGFASEENFEKTLDVTIRTINFAKNNKNVPLTVFKPTGVGRIELYEKVSNNEILTAAEKEEWLNVRNRYYKIVQAAYDAKVPIMVDAEESWIQPAIDELVQELKVQFNQKQAIIWNTAQMYRWDRLDYLKRAVAHAKENGYFFGIKVVRGAYMEKERARAQAMNYKDPIQPNKAACDKDYDAAIELLIANHTFCSIMVATHNQNSISNMAAVMAKHGLEKGHKSIFAAQLFGMSDDLSMNTAQAGYNVIKYLPFGTVEVVMPYLFRRAEENTSVKGQTGRELALLEKEIERRKKAKNKAYLQVQA